MATKIVQVTSYNLQDPVELQLTLPVVFENNRSTGMPNSFSSVGVKKYLQIKSIDQKYSSLCTYNENLKRPDAIESIFAVSS